MKKNEDDLKKRIKDRLLSLGLTNSMIHKKTGIPKGTISGMLSDNPSLSIENLYKIATTFGISMDYLFGLTDLKSIESDYKIIHSITGLSDQAISNIEKIYSSFKDLKGIAFDMYDEIQKTRFEGLENLLSSNNLDNFLIPFECFVTLKFNQEEEIKNYGSSILDYFTKEEIEYVYLMHITDEIKKMKKTNTDERREQK